MALTAELRTKLLDEDEPPTKRLKLAHDVFISQQLRVERKEEIALESLCSLMNTNSSNPKTWETMLSCLNNPRMKHMNGAEIQPAIKKMLITALKTTLGSTSEPEEIKSLACQCALVVLQASCMEQYLSRKSKEFIELCVKLIEYVSDTKPSSSSSKMIKQVIGIILAYHRKQPQEMNFRSKFLSNLLMPLIIIESKWLTETNEEINLKELSVEIIKCFQIIAISKQHLEIYESILNYILGITSYSEYLNDSLVVLVHKCVATSSTFQGIPILLSNIIQSFATSYKKSDLVVKMFVVLCYIVGLYPTAENDESCIVNKKRLQEVVDSEVLVDHSDSQKKSALKSFREMLNVMAKEEIVFEECNLGTETGREWLARIATRVLHMGPTCIAEDITFALSPLVKIDLLVLENLLPDITSWISSISDSTIHPEKAFHLLLSESLKVAEKQQRTHKLIAKILDGIKLAKDFDSQNIEALIPDEFLENLKNSCALMHSKHVASLISSIIFHLEGCVVSIEASFLNADEGDVAYLHAVSRLLYSVLITSRCAQHTTATPVLDKFCSQMKTVAILLQRLEKVFSKLSENTTILECLLMMSIGWGEVHLLLLHYVDSDSCSITPPKKLTDDQNPFNLSMLHSHIHGKQWINLAKRTSKHKTCSKLMVSLVAQKYRAVVLLNLAGSNSSLNNIAEILVTKGTPGPLYPSLGLLVSSLDDNHKEHLAKAIAADLLSDGPWCQMLLHHLDQNCDKLIGSVALEILTLMSKKRFGCLSSVLKSLDIKNTESDQLENIATKLCKVLMNCTPNQSGANMEAYLLSLDKLPLKQMPKSVRCACILAILASCANLDDSWTCSAQILIKLLGSAGKETPLPASMNYGALIHWLVNSVKDNFVSPKWQSTFVSALLGNLTSSPESVSQGIKSLKKALESSPSMTTASVCNFLLPYMHNRVQRKESKNYELFKKYEQDLANLVLPCIVQHKNDSLLPALCTALLAIESSDLVDQGLNVLPDLLSEAILNNSTDSVVAVLECIVALPEPLREKIMPLLWQHLCLAPDLPSAGYNCIQKLLSAASNEETERVIDILCSYEMEVGFGLWKLLIQMCIGEKKEVQWMRKLQSKLRFSILSWELSEVCLQTKTLPTLDLLITITKSKVELDPTMLDLILDSILALQLDKRDVNDFVLPLRSAISLMNSLLTSRGVLMQERIPVFQQRLAVLLASLACSSPPTLQPDLANQLAACAHAIERIGVGIYLYKRDFARVASYMVADVLNLFEHYTIHHSVKTHLEKYLHSLLRLCDEHAEHFLLGVLSPASQQLLRSELKQTKKEKQMKV